MIYSLLFVLLFVAGSTLASPTCSDEEAAKCSDKRVPSWVFDTWPNTETELGKICLKAIPELDCQIDFAERCPESLVGLHLQPLKEFKKLLDQLCDKSNNLRKEYFRRVTCINHKMSIVRDACHDDADVTTPNFDCSVAVHKSERCFYGAVRDNCSKPHADLFRSVYQPFVALAIVQCEYAMNHKP